MREMANTVRVRAIRPAKARRGAALVGVFFGFAATLSAAGSSQEQGGIPANFRDADHLLTVLETGDEDINTLRAAVELANEYGPLEGNEKQKRRGTLYFSTGNAVAEAEGEGQRAFRVDFSELYLPSDEEGVWVLHEEEKSYIFDGRILLELVPARKFAIKRVVAGPEEEVDPLAIGEGPFPIPIGQRKDEILKRFEAELLEPEAGFEQGRMPPKLKGTVQLRLVPKPGAEEAEDFNEVRIWYTRHDADGDDQADYLLPIKARTINTDDSKADVNLANIVVNADVGEGIFSTTPPTGWEVQADDLRRDARGQE